MKRTPTLLLLLLLVAGPGCATFGPGLEPPEVTLVSLSPVAGELLEQRFAVGLRVLNPNDTALEVEGLDFTLDLNGTRLSRGVSGELFTVPRLGDELVTVVVTTTVFDLFRQALAATRATAVEYELHGRVFLGGSVGTLPFEQQGTFRPAGLGGGS